MKLGYGDLITKDNKIFHGEILREEFGVTINRDAPQVPIYVPIENVSVIDFDKREA